MMQQKQVNKSEDQDMIRLPGWKFRDTFELDEEICVVKILRKNSLDQLLSEFHESEVELEEQDSMTTNDDAIYSELNSMDINIPEMKHGFSISHDCAEKQTSICDEHSGSRESEEILEEARNQLLLPFGTVEAYLDCIDLHPIRTNKPINAMQDVNIHLKNAIHIGMPIMCSSGDEHNGDLEKHERSESRNPKVKQSFSVESKETSAGQSFSKLNSIHNSLSKQNSFELFHRRYELQPQDVDTDEDGTFLKEKEISYHIESPEFVFERKVGSDLNTDIFKTRYEYDEISSELYHFEVNNIVTRNDWIGCFYATFPPIGLECLNTNFLKKEFLPRMLDCLSNITSGLILTSSTLTTRILNFCRPTCLLYTCLLHTCLFPLMMPAATAEIIVNEKHLTVIVGPSVRLHCSVNLPDPVIWRHEHVGTGDPNYVYHYSFGLMGQYRSGRRHSIENGTNDLVIMNVTDSDAGKYTCEVKELEKYVDAYDIVILKSGPSCTANIDLSDVIGENDCGIDPDMLHLRCSVAYSGNTAPRLHWQNSGGEHAMFGSNISTPIQDETNHSTESTLTVTANMGLHDTHFTCQVADSQSDGIVPECRTEKMTVHSLYNSSVAPEINMKNKKEISCAANSSQPCNYQWTHQYEKYKIAINGSTLNFQDVSFGDGIYECQAECRLREQICHTMPRRITVVNGGMKNCEKTVDDSTLRDTAIAFVVISIVLLAIGAACCALLLKNRKHKDRRTKKPTQVLKTFTLLQIRLRSSSKLNSRNIEVPQTDIDRVSLSSPCKKVEDNVPVQVANSGDHHSLESQEFSLFSSNPSDMIDLQSDL